MIAGLLDNHALSVLSAEERREVRHIVVLRDCLEIAMRECAFAALPTSRQALRVIRQRLSEAGIEVNA